MINMAPEDFHRDFELYQEVVKALQELSLKTQKKASSESLQGALTAEDKITTLLSNASIKDLEKLKNILDPEYFFLHSEFVHTKITFFIRLKNFLTKHRWLGLVAAGGMILTGILMMTGAGAIAIMGLGALIGVVSLSMLFNEDIERAYAHRVIPTKFVEVVVENVVEKKVEKTDKLAADNWYNKLIFLSKKIDGVLCAREKSSDDLSRAIKEENNKKSITLLLSKMTTGNKETGFHLDSASFITRVRSFFRSRA